MIEHMSLPLRFVLQHPCRLITQRQNSRHRISGLLTQQRGYHIPKSTRSHVIWRACVLSSRLVTLSLARRRALRATSPQFRGGGADVLLQGDCPAIGAEGWSGQACPVVEIALGIVGPGIARCQGLGHEGA